MKITLGIIAVTFVMALYKKTLNNVGLESAAQGNEYID